MTPLSSDYLPFFALLCALPPVLLRVRFLFCRELHQLFMLVQFRREHAHIEKFAQFILYLRSLIAEREQIRAVYFQLTYRKRSTRTNELIVKLAETHGRRGFVRTLSHSVRIDERGKIFYNVRVPRDEYEHFAATRTGVPVVHVPAHEPRRLIDHLSGKTQFGKHPTRYLLAVYLVILHAPRAPDRLRLAYVVHERGKAQFGRSGAHLAVRVFEGVVLVVAVGSRE